VVKYLSGKLKALSSTPNTANNKKQEKKAEGYDMKERNKTAGFYMM
jgi:hypothetical protein